MHHWIADGLFHPFAGAGVLSPMESRTRPCSLGTNQTLEAYRGGREMAGNGPGSVRPLRTAQRWWKQKPPGTGAR